jgi:4-amino-4-deoxy-L-arabinose transferase-like glycosyltransferase
MALAVGEFFGLAWLVNPILGGVNVLLAYFLVSAIYDRRIANWVVLLMAASPWALFMAMNFMTHTFTLTCALAAGLGLVQSKRTRKASWALLAGGAIGMASLIRPLDGLIVAAVVGLAALGLGGRRLTIPSLAALTLGTILVGAAVLPYNKFLTGKATVFPLMAYTDRHFGPNTNALGFGPDRGLGWPLQPFPGHSPLGAIINSNLNVFSLDTELLGWSVGSLLLLALLLLAGRIRGADYLMLGVIVLVFVLHFFYWYSGGPDFGARYWFLMLLPLLVLTARAVRFLEEKFAASTEESPTNGSGRVKLAVLALCAITAVTYIPWRAIDKYHHYLRMRPDVRNLARQYNFGSSLVLIRGDGHPDYASAAVYNPLNLRDEVPIYAWDRSPEVRAQLLKAYAGRPVYIVDGPSVTSGGFKVVKGPVTTNYLLRSLGQLGQPDDVNAR